MAILDYFMVAPGDRKRAEMEQKLLLERLAKEYELRRQAAAEPFMVQEKIRQVNKVADEKEQLELLRAHAIGQGMTPEEADVYARKNFTNIRVAKPLADMTSALVEGARGQGALPFAPMTGEREEQARALKGEAERTGAYTNILKSSAEQQTAPGRIFAENRAATRGAQNLLTQATAMEPFVSPLTLATSQRELAGARLGTAADTSALTGIENLTKAKQLADIERARAEEIEAHNARQTALNVDPNLTAEAITAETLAQRNQSRYNQVVPARLPNIDLNTPQSIINLIQRGATNMIPSSALPVRGATNPPSLMNQYKEIPGYGRFRFTGNTRKPQ